MLDYTCPECGKEQCITYGACEHCGYQYSDKELEEIWAVNVAVTERPMNPFG